MRAIIEVLGVFGVGLGVRSRRVASRVDGELGAMRPRGPTETVWASSRRLVAIAIAISPIAGTACALDPSEPAGDGVSAETAADGGSDAKPTTPPPPYEPCTNYNRGGSSGVHYYTCCNNCPGGTTNSGTYQGGSTGAYCGACGANTGGGTAFATYSCGGKTNQDACKNSCNAIAPTAPGSCWDWDDCFTQCCGIQTSGPVCVPKPKDGGGGG